MIRKLDDLVNIRENIRPNYMVVPLKHYRHDKCFKSGEGV